MVSWAALSMHESKSFATMLMALPWTVMSLERVLVRCLKRVQLALLQCHRGKVASVLDPRFSFKTKADDHFHAVALLSLF